MAVRKVWYILGQNCRFNGSISYTKYFLETLKVVYYFQEVPFVRYVGWLILEIASLEKKALMFQPRELILYRRSFQFGYWNGIFRYRFVLVYRFGITIVIIIIIIIIIILEPIPSMFFTT